MSYYIGIDPGEATGVCEYQHGGTYRMETTTFWGCIGIIDARYRMWGVHLRVVLSAGWLNQSVFARRGVPTYSRRQLRIASNVGHNHAHGRLIADYCEHHGIECELSRPSSAKWTADTLERITRYHGSSSQHARDAAALVWGRQ